MAKHRLTALALAAAVACTGGCGTAAGTAQQKPSAAKPAAATPAPAPKAAAKAAYPLTVSWDFTVNGFEAPMYAALARGYYRRQGLSVHFVQANSASVSNQWVATGKVGMGFTGIDQAVKTVPQGAPVKIVAMVMQQSPFGLVYRASHPVRRPTDLYGGTIGTLTGSQADISLREFISKTGLDRARLKITSVSPKAVAGLFGQGRLTAFAAAAYGFLPPLEKLGVHAGYLPFSTFGVGATGESVEAATTLLKTHPAVVRGFLYATAQGFAFAKAHPRQAVADELRYAHSLNAGMTLAQLKLVFPLLHTANTQGKPWGWQSPRDWQHQLRLLQRFEGVKKVLPLSRYYTNAYLPTGAVKAP